MTKSIEEVKSHDFTAEMLDSPAIEALVEYKWSIYNLVDLGTFGSLLVASINQLLIISGKITGDTPQEGNSWMFTYASTGVFFHCFVDLRVFRNICTFVTLFEQMVIMTRGYFAFTAAGRYDPVNNEFDSHNWPFLLGMALYYMIMVILMFNVFIGYRQAINCFPEEIYYTATAKEVVDYKATNSSKDSTKVDLLKISLQYSQEQNVRLQEELKEQRTQNLKLIENLLSIRQ
ncbi:hypothetical protein BGZ58_006622 [Dissophora ornata]|nr:hypothetical protein BGZ58_006622 [Dissophora ornata]